MCFLYDIFARNDQINLFISQYINSLASSVLDNSQWAMRMQIPLWLEWVRTSHTLTHVDMVHARIKNSLFVPIQTSLRCVFVYYAGFSIFNQCICSTYISNARSVPMQKHYGVYVVFPPRMPINIEIKTKTWIQCCVVPTLRLGSMLFIHLWFYLRILSASHPQHFFQYMLMRTKYRLLANGLFARKKIIVRFAAHLFIFIFSVLYFLFYISLYVVFYSFFSLHAVFFAQFPTVIDAFRTYGFVLLRYILNILSSS